MTWVVGHRGAMGHAPENTFASFRKAVALGVDAVECDVHLSKDGVLVVHHDETLDRTTSGKGFIRDHSWAAIRSLDAGGWFHRSFSRERPPSLPALLRWAKPQRAPDGSPLRVVVEIKNEKVRYPGIAEKTVAALRRAGMRRRAVVISFNHDTMARVKKLDPGIKTGLLFARRLRDLAARMKRAGADAVFPRHLLVTRGFMDEARRRGWFVGTWTANDVSDLRRLTGLGVDAVAGNYPERIRRLLDR